jgi:spermidine synthase
MKSPAPFHPKLHASRGLRVYIAAVMTLLALTTVVGRQGAIGDEDAADLGPVDVEVKSEFSRIRVRRSGTVRTMVFVRDSGDEALESQVDLAEPHELRFPYLRYMFLSYVFRPEHDKVLIVGLGGGAMIHFIKQYDPDCQVDVVEIDPAVVRIAEEYFMIRSDSRTNIIAQDAVKYLSETDSQYDVIYMDAFLKPSEATDSTGVPLTLRTRSFYDDLRKRLKPDGLVVFNVHYHRGVRDDIKVIHDAFPHAYLFSIPQRSSFVVVASLSRHPASKRDLLRRAKLVDDEFKASFSFQEMIQTMER